MSTIPLDITAEQGECNGFMTTAWYVNDRLLTPTYHSHQKNINMQLEISMPCRIAIVCSGKNQETDTELIDGKIVKDKYFCITSASLGRYPIDKDVLCNRLIVFAADAGDTKHTAYFYANGVATLEFTENNALLWHLKHNHFYQW